LHSKEVFRALDANINRAAEGIRTLEDIARFSFNHAELTEKLRVLRHQSRKLSAHLQTEFLAARNSCGDVGLAISKQSQLDDKSTLPQLTSAGFKRLQEALRVIEECLKLAAYYELAKEYEALRYRTYTLEKEYNDVTNRVLRRLPKTDLYCLTAEEHSAGRPNLEVVKAMVDAGIRIIQYREKDKKLLYKYEECKKIRELTKEAGVTFIVNDDIHLAVAVGADGVHIGQEDLPIEEVRKLVGEQMIIGLSTHSPQQAQAAVTRGADYIGVGPIFTTATKRDVCAPVGLAYLEYAVQNISIPLVAIGGIKEHNIKQVRQKGATCFALVTEIVGAADIAGKIRDIRKKIEEENKI
jgi:thiamine-phosphate pyrophosphorylase